MWLNKPGALTTLSIWVVLGNENVNLWIQSSFIGPSLLLPCSWESLTKSWQKPRTAGNLQNQCDSLHPKYCHGPCSGGCSAGSKSSRRMCSQCRQRSRPVEQRKNFQGVFYLMTETIIIVTEFFFGLIILCSCHANPDVLCPFFLIQRKLNERRMTALKQESSDSESEDGTTTYRSMAGMWRQETSNDLVSVVHSCLFNFRVIYLHCCQQEQEVRTPITFWTTGTWLSHLFFISSSAEQGVILLGSSGLLMVMTICQWLDWDNI